MKHKHEEHEPVHKKTHAHKHEDVTPPDAPVLRDPKPVADHHEEEDQLKDEHGTVRGRGIVGCFVKVKETGKVGYIKSHSPENKDAPYCVGVFTVSILGAGVGASPHHCKLNDLVFLYDS